MTPMIVSKTANGYIVYPQQTDGGVTPFEQTHVAFAIHDGAWRRNGVSVAEILESHFEPKTEADKEAA